VIRRIPIDTGMCHKSIEKTMTVFRGIGDKGEGMI
jgi:hypothetical protein